MISRFRNFGAAQHALALTASLALICTLTASANGQRPHHLVRGNMIPGQASQLKLMASPSKAGQIQPVKVIVPDGVELSVVSRGSFLSTDSSAHTAGMQLGLLYRFRVTGVDVATRFELYPSIELLDLLHPPAGLANDFPIPVVITASDLRQATAGKLVTKVVYLEDPEVALPRGGIKDEQPYIDISAAEDPIRAAEGLGRPMAILRIGSRVPTSEELANSSTNAFNSATPTMADESRQPALKLNPKYRSPVFPAAGLPANMTPAAAPRK